MTTPGFSRVLVDVTQFASWPASSGVQRVLLHLAREWPASGIAAEFGFIDGAGYRTGRIQEFASVVESMFRSEFADHDGNGRLVRSALEETARRLVPHGKLEERYRGYLLPEPTLRAESLEVAARLANSRRTASFFLHYDALPLTHPELYPRRADRGDVTRYHRLVAESNNVAFISSVSRELFEERLSRRRIRNALVVNPGADGLRKAAGPPPDPPTFVVVGTVEPRKRHRLVLDAFEKLWSAGRNYRLELLGSAGWEEPEFLGRIRRLSRSDRLEWVEQASDSTIADTVARASALLFTPHAEGYGLPPLEALGIGCPVIVPATLPALMGLPADGQLRLEAVTAESVAAAVETLADPLTNSAYRRAAASLRLPKWKDFVSDVEAWMTATVAI